MTGAAQALRDRLARGTVDESLCESALALLMRQSEELGVPGETNVEDVRSVAEVLDEAACAGDTHHHGYLRALADASHVLADAHEERRAVDRAAALARERGWLPSLRAAAVQGRFIEPRPDIDDLVEAGLATPIALGGTSRLRHYLSRRGEVVAKVAT